MSYNHSNNSNYLPAYSEVYEVDPTEYDFTPFNAGSHEYIPWLPDSAPPSYAESCSSISSSSSPTAAAGNHHLDAHSQQQQAVAATVLRNLGLSASAFRAAAAAASSARRQNLSDDDGGNEAYEEGPDNEAGLMGEDPTEGPTARIVQQQREQQREQWLRQQWQQARQQWLQQQQQLQREYDEEDDDDDDDDDNDIDPADLALESLEEPDLLHLPRNPRPEWEWYTDADGVQRFRSTIGWQFVPRGPREPEALWSASDDGKEEEVEEGEEEGEAPVPWPSRACGQQRMGVEEWMGLALERWDDGQWPGQQ